MAITSNVERQQAIEYIKARLCRLSERKSALIQDYQGAEGHLANQIKVLDWKIDTLLETLGKLTDDEVSSELRVFHASSIRAGTGTDTSTTPSRT